MDVMKPKANNTALFRQILSLPSLLEICFFSGVLEEVAVEVGEGGAGGTYEATG